MYDQDHHLGKGLGYPFAGQYPSKARCRTYDEHDARSSDNCILHRTDKPLQGHFAIRNTQHQRIDDGYSPGFGGSEYTKADSTDDDHWQTKRKEGLLEGFEQLPLGKRLRPDGDIGTFLGDHAYQNHHGQAQQQPGADTGDKEFPNRDVCNGTVEDHGDSRRYEGGDHRGDCDNNGRKLLGIPLALHLGTEHLRFHGRIGQGGTGQAAHQSRQQDIDLGQASGHPACEDCTEMHDPICHTAAVHEHTSGNKKRYRKQGGVLNT